MKIDDLHTAIEAICPIYGVSADGRISFAGSPTQQQMDDANAFAAANLPNAVDDAEDDKVVELDGEYLAAISADIVYNTKTFQANERARKSLETVLASMGATAPADFYWMDTSNDQIAFTRADADALSKAIFDRGWIAFKNLQVKKALVRVAVGNSDIPAINAINW